MTLKITPEEDPFRKFDPIDPIFDVDTKEIRKVVDKANPAELNDDYLKAYEAYIRKLPLEELYEILDIIQDDPTPGRINIVNRRIQQIETDGFDPTRDSYLREMEEATTKEKSSKEPAEETPIEETPVQEPTVQYPDIAFTRNETVKNSISKKKTKPIIPANPVDEKQQELSRKAKSRNVSEAEMSEILQTLDELEEKYKDYTPPSKCDIGNMKDDDIALFVAIPVVILLVAILISFFKSML